MIGSREKDNIKNKGAKMTIKFCNAMRLGWVEEWDWLLGVGFAVLSLLFLVFSLCSGGTKLVKVGFTFSIRIL